MRAVLQHGIRDLRLAEIPAPTPQPGEALVRIRSVTICASDLHMFAEGNVGGVSWDQPFVPGHEAAGIVEDPNNTPLPPGSHVVLDPAISCGACDLCALGHFHLCRHLKFCDLPPVHGAMRELVPWPANRLFVLPDSVDIIEAPLIEPLCIAVHALQLAPPLQHAALAVVGCGAIGLFIIRLARLRGARTIFATDPVPERLALARHLGADITIPVGPQDPAAVILSATDGRGVALTFEAAGPPEALQQALDIVRPAGEVVVIGIPSDDEYRLRPSQLRRHELTLRFVRRQNESFPEAIALVHAGAVNLTPLLTHRFPAERAQEAFELAHGKADGALRVAVTF